MPVWLTLICYLVEGKYKKYVFFVLSESVSNLKQKHVQIKSFINSKTWTININVQWTNIITHFLINVERYIIIGFMYATLWKSIDYY